MTWFRRALGIAYLAFVIWVGTVHGVNWAIYTMVCYLFMGAAWEDFFDART